MSNQVSSGRPKRMLSAVEMFKLGKWCEANADRVGLNDAPTLAMMASGNLGFEVSTANVLTAAECAGLRTRMQIARSVDRPIDRGDRAAFLAGQMLRLFEAMKMQPDPRLRAIASHTAG